MLLNPEPLQEPVEEASKEAEQEPEKKPQPTAPKTFAVLLRETERADLYCNPSSYVVAYVDRGPEAIYSEHIGKIKQAKYSGPYGCDC